MAVPEADLRQRERELQIPEFEDPGWTADTIERILRTDPVVQIDRIDEFAMPWFNYVFPGGEWHTLAIMDDVSWDYCDAPG